jgi:hypothetical protein
MPKTDVTASSKDPRVSGGNIIGWCLSPKNGIGTQQRYHSTIERDLNPFLAAAEDILGYGYHPFKILSYAYKGEFHPYTPDVEAIRKASKQLLECKPETELGSDDVKRQVTIGRAWSYEHQYDELWVVTDKMLRTGPKLETLKKLFRFHRKSIDFSTLTATKDILRAHPDGVRLADLLVTLSGNETDFHHLPDIFSLIWQHILDIDLDHPLDHESLVWLRREDSIWTLRRLLWGDSNSSQA